jgi:hypothetical protein
MQHYNLEKDFYKQFYEILDKAYLLIEAKKQEG